MKTIPLTQSKVALVDDTDYDFLSKYNWCAAKTIGRSYYAVRGSLISDLRQGCIHMHRIILNAPKGVEVDHRDGNSLNNQRSNLRLCTHGENQRNQGLHHNNTTGFKGVRLDRRAIQNPYNARIQINNKEIHIGCYKTAEKAARAYDTTALKYHGDYRVTNEMLGLLPGRK